MSSHRRVVVTGLGVLCSVADSAKDFSNALRRGDSGFAPIKSFDTIGFPTNYGSEVKDFDSSGWIVHEQIEKIGKSSQFAISASKQAIADAGLDLQTLQSHICGVSIGTTDGDSDLIEKLNKDWAANDDGNLNHLSYLAHLSGHRLSALVSRELGLVGDACTIATACAAGNYAIGYAYDLVRNGEADFMICGGAESMSRTTFAKFTRAGSIASEKCQPFSGDRLGLITGEGAGVILIESLETARQRGARIYGEILGYGLSCDGFHPSAPDKEGIVRALRNALSDAGVSTDQVDYICAHGTGTKLNDTTELAALRQVIGGKLPPISSVKSMIGHTLGAAGALGAIACLIGMTEHFLPPTINWNCVDPECGDHDFVTNGARTASPNVIMNNSFGVGGNNAILIFGRESWREQQVEIA